jgi:hypothetical protein
LDDKTISKSESFSFIIKKSNTKPAKLCLTLAECRVPSHSIRLLDDLTAIYLNSTSGELLHFSPKSCEILSVTRIGNQFLRGAEQIDDGRIFIGDNNELIHFDLPQQKVISKTPITKDKAEAIFDVHKLPENFALPPASFPEHHKLKLPVRQV